MPANLLDIEMLESAIVGVVKQNQNGHHFAETHVPGTIPMQLAILQQRPVELRMKIDNKLVQIVEECDDIHGGLLAERLLKFW
jgi:hypothetical protein